MSSADSPNDGSKKPRLERIRDNQRRSRARKREYVEDLERRLNHCRKICHEAELQSTTVMDLQQENQRLRELLSSRGVGEDVVRAYLSQAQGPAGQSQLRPLRPKRRDDGFPFTPVEFLTASGQSQPLLNPTSQITTLLNTGVDEPLAQTSCVCTSSAHVPTSEGAPSAQEATTLDEDILGFSLDGLDFGLYAPFEDGSDSQGWTEDDSGLTISYQASSHSRSEEPQPRSNRGG